MIPRTVPTSVLPCSVVALLIAAAACRPVATEPAPTPVYVGEISVPPQQILCDSLNDPARASENDCGQTPAPTSSPQQDPESAESPADTAPESPPPAEPTEAPAAAPSPASEPPPSAPPAATPPRSGPSAPQGGPKAPPR
jgi:hypothetical protein